MVTELELMGNVSGPGERYVLRCHKPRGAEGMGLDVGVPNASMSWSGFRYRNTEVSILLLRRERSAAA